MSTGHISLKQSPFAGSQKKLAMRAGLFVALAIVATAVLGPLALFPGLSASLGFLYLPVIAALLMFTLSSVAEAVLAGRLARPLTYAIDVAGVTLFVAIAAASDVMPAGVNGLALPLLAAGLTLGLYLLGEAHSRTVKILSWCLMVAAAGTVAFAIPALLELSDGPALGWLLLAGFEVAAAAGLVGLFRKHHNEYLAYPGKLFSHWGRPAIVGAIFAGLLGYERYVRPFMISLFSGGVVLLEWLLAVAVVGYAVFTVLRMVRTISVGRKHGDLQALVQRLSFDKLGIAAATTAVEGFVDRGKKDGLIVYITLVLLESQVPPHDVENIIAGIVNHSDEPSPALVLKWASGDVAATNRAARMTAVNRAIAEASEAISHSQTVEPGTGHNR